MAQVFHRFLTQRFFPLHTQYTYTESLKQTNKQTCLSCLFLSFSLRLSSSTILLRRSFKERCDVINDCSLYSCGVIRSQKDTAGTSDGTVNWKKLSGLRNLQKKTEILHRDDAFDTLVLIFTCLILKINFFTTEDKWDTF